MGGWSGGEHDQPGGEFRASSHDAVAEVAAKRRRVVEAHIHQFDAAGNAVLLLDARHCSINPEDLFREVLFAHRASSGPPHPEIFGIVSRAGAALRADFRFCRRQRVRPEPGWPRSRPF